METTITHGPGGWRVEWYREDDAGNGWCAYWYGSEADCKRRAILAPPRMHPMSDSNPRGDAATATGMYDAY